MSLGSLADPGSKFHVLWRKNEFRAAFKQFCLSCHVYDFLFLESVEELQFMLGKNVNRKDMLKTAQRIRASFLDGNDCLMPINCSAQTREEACKRLDEINKINSSNNNNNNTMEEKTLAQYHSDLLAIFAENKVEVEKLLGGDVLPRFLKDAESGGTSFAMDNDKDGHAIVLFKNARLPSPDQAALYNFTYISSSSGGSSSGSSGGGSSGNKRSPRGSFDGSSSPSSTSSSSPSSFLANSVFGKRRSSLTMDSNKYNEPLLTPVHVTMSAPVPPLQSPTTTATVSGSSSGSVTPLKLKQRTLNSMQDLYSQLQESCTNFEIATTLACVCVNEEEEALAEVLVDLFSKTPITMLHILNHLLHREVTLTDVEGETFRRNSITSKITIDVIKMNATPWVIQCIGTPVKSLMEKARGSFEIDPAKLAHEGGDTAEVQAKKNMEKLKKTLAEILHNLTTAEALETCPLMLRLLCASIYRATESKFVNYGFRALANFLFLRFICPSLTAPDQFGYFSDKPDAFARRGYMIVSKVLMALANNTPLRGEECYLGFNSFLDQNNHVLIQLFKNLITTSSYASPNMTLTSSSYTDLPPIREETLDSSDTVAAPLDDMPKSASTEKLKVVIPPLPMSSLLTLTSDDVDPIALSTGGKGKVVNPRLEPPFDSLLGLRLHKSVAALRDVLAAAPPFDSNTTVDEFDSISFRINKFLIAECLKNMGPPKSIPNLSSSVLKSSASSMTSSSANSSSSKDLPNSSAPSSANLQPAIDIAPPSLREKPSPLMNVLRSKTDLKASDDSLTDAPSLVSTLGQLQLQVPLTPTSPPNTSSINSDRTALGSDRSGDGSSPGTSPVVGGGGGGGGGGVGGGGVSGAGVSSSTSGDLGSPSAGAAPPPKACRVFVDASVVSGLATIGVMMQKRQTVHDFLGSVAEAINKRAPVQVNAHKLDLVIETLATAKTSKFTKTAKHEDDVPFDICSDPKYGFVVIRRAVELGSDWGRRTAPSPATNTASSTTTTSASSSTSSTGSATSVAPAGGNIRKLAPPPPPSSLSKLPPGAKPKPVGAPVIAVEADNATPAVGTTLVPPAVKVPTSGLAPPTTKARGRLISERTDQFLTKLANPTGGGSSTSSQASLTAPFPKGSGEYLRSPSDNSLSEDTNNNNRKLSLSESKTEIPNSISEEGIAPKPSESPVTTEDQTPTNPNDNNNNNDI